jgi:hypothetical protein
VVVELLTSGIDLCIMHANTEILDLVKILTVLAFFRVKREDRDEQLS